MVSWNPRADFSPRLSWFELRKTFDEFFGAATRKAHGNAAVFLIAFHSDYGPDSIARVANLAAKHGIGARASSCRRPPERACGSRRLGSGRRGSGFSAHAPKKLIRRIRVFGIRLITAGFADLGHRAADGLH